MTLPLIAPGVISAALLSFALSIDDFVISNFNSGSTVTFLLYIFGANQRGIPVQVNVIATMLFAVTVIAMIAVIPAAAPGREGSGPAAGRDRRQRKPSPSPSDPVGDHAAGRVGPGGYAVDRVVTPRDRVVTPRGRVGVAGTDARAAFSRAGPGVSRTTPTRPHGYTDPEKPRRPLDPTATRTREKPQ